MRWHWIACVAAMGMAASAGSAKAADPTEPAESSLFGFLDFTPENYTWGGHYFGNHWGWAFADIEASESVRYNGSPAWNYDADGLVGGFHIGYNWQWGGLVFGPTVEIGYLGIEGSAADPRSPGRDTTSSVEGSFFTGGAVRLGYALNNFLVYGKGGVIYADFDVQVKDTCTTGACGGGFVTAQDNGFDLGWQAGGGIEWGFTTDDKELHRWAMRFEYMFLDFGKLDASSTAGGTLAGPARWSHDVQAHTIKAGVNFFW